MDKKQPRREWHGRAAGELVSTFPLMRAGPSCPLALHAPTLPIGGRGICHSCLHHRNTHFMPLYFAYGANLDVEAMALRCPRSRFVGVARLARHRFALMKEGFATVVRDPQSNVHGVLYDLALADIPALDRYEEVSSGLYQKVTQPILRQQGGPVRALVYMGRGGEARGAMAKPGYMEAIIRHAQAHHLPREHIAYLAHLAPTAVNVEAPQPKRAIKYTGKPLFGDSDD